MTTDGGATRPNRPRESDHAGDPHARRRPPRWARGVCDTSLRNGSAWCKGQFAAENDLSAPHSALARRRRAVPPRERDPDSPEETLTGPNCPKLTMPDLAQHDEPLMGRPAPCPPRGAAIDVPRSSAGANVLARVALTPAQRASLARQGCIVEERRGARKRVFKLRFRHERQTVVRYLTSDPEIADAARAALAELQAERRAMRNLRRVVCEARRALRRTKDVSTPLLEAAGLAYHGLAIRHPRRRVSGEHNP